MIAIPPVSPEPTDDAGPGIASPRAYAAGLGPSSVLALSAACGLVAGLLEVATLVARKSWFDANRLYGMSRHFVWLIPTIDLGLFLALGALALLAAFARLSPRRGARLAARLLGALTLLAAVMVAFPKIYGPAWLLVLIGGATRLGPAVRPDAAGFRGLIRWGFAIAAGITLALAASTWAEDRAREAAERSRPTPPSGSPNILLVVLDAVAAGHLDLYG